MSLSVGHKGYNRAALAYYFDHRAEIDERMAQDQSFVEELRKRTERLISCLPVLLDA